MKTEIKYHENGKVAGVIRRDEHGKLHGLTEWWYENGTLGYRDNWEHGKKHGLAEVWYENGTLMYRDNYEYGKLHGLSEGWHENGTQWFRCNYENGKLIPDETDSPTGQGGE